MVFILILSFMNAGLPSASGQLSDAGPQVHFNASAPGVGYTQHDPVSAGGILGGLGGAGFAVWLSAVVPGGFIIMPVTAALGATVVGTGTLLWCAAVDSAPTDHFSHCLPWSSKFRGLDIGRHLALVSAPECSSNRIMTHLTSPSGRAESREFILDQGKLVEILMADESAVELNSRVSLRLRVEGENIVEGISDRDGRVQTRLRPRQLRHLRGLLSEAASRFEQCGKPFPPISELDRATKRTEPLHNLHEDALH